MDLQIWLTVSLKTKADLPSTCLLSALPLFACSHLLVSTQERMESRCSEVRRYVSCAYLNRSMRKCSDFIFRAEGPEHRRTCGSVSQTKLFMHGRAEDERRELSSAKFISLMSDGCTDSSVTEEEPRRRSAEVGGLILLVYRLQKSTRHRYC